MQIGAKGAEFIADALKYNTTISVLDLRANGLRDEVCFSVPWVIFPTDPLLFRYSSINVSGSQGALCLARSLKVVNEALTSLDLGFNEIRVWVFVFYIHNGFFIIKF